MTVLILATERDIGADRMVRVLTDRGVPVFRADIGWFPQQLTLDAELRNGQWTGRLATPYREVALEELRSVWYRSPSTCRFPAAMSDQQWIWLDSPAGDHTWPLTSRSVAQS